MSDSDRFDVDARFAEIIAHWDDTPLRAAEVESRVEPVERTTSGEAPPMALAPDPLAERWALGDDPSLAGPQTPDRGPTEFGTPDPGTSESRTPDARNSDPGSLDPGSVDRGNVDAGIAVDPVDEDLGRPRPPDDAGSDPTGVAGPAADERVWRGAGSRPKPEVEPEEHFEPPAPAPLPAGDLHFWGILVGLCGGPLLLLYLIVFDRDAGSLWTATAILLTLGGFGLLVARQPHRRPDDGDDGARL